MQALIDGTGSGFLAKVGSDNRLATDSIIESIHEKATSEGDGYNVATPPITLTTTNESALIYIKNGEDQDLVITSVFLNTFNSVGTLVGAQPRLKVYRNPNNGTLISNAVDIPGINISNSNFGSAKILVADIYHGVEGDTVTGHSALIDIPLPTRGALTLNVFDTTVVMPKGSAFVLSYQPEPGSTSVDVIAGVRLIKLPVEFA